MLEIRNRVVGPESNQTKIAENNLAVCFRNAGQYVVAAELQRSILAWCAAMPNLHSTHLFVGCVVSLGDSLKRPIRSTKLDWD